MSFDRKFLNTNERDRERKKTYEKEKIKISIDRLFFLPKCLHNHNDGRIDRRALLWPATNLNKSIFSLSF